MSSSKVQIAYNRILDILAESERAWDLELLLWQVNYELDLEQMVGMTTLRRAVALLPEACRQRAGRRIIVQARAFATAPEVIAALQALPHWSDYLPVLIERHKPTLCRALALDSVWALLQSIAWASAGVFTVDYTVYGVSVRWLKAVAS